MSVKYLDVMTHFPPDFHFGGVVNSGYQLFQALKTYGNVKVITVSRRPAAVLQYLRDDGKCYRSCFFHKYAFSFSLIGGLLAAISASDVVYVNGIVSFPTTLAKIYAMILHKPYAAATHGLTQWSAGHKKWRKLPYLRLLVFPLLRRAKFIRVTSGAEEKYLHANGVMNTVMISNGITLGEFKELPVRSKSEKFVFLFLGRIGQEKGLDILIQAYRKFCQKYPLRSHELMLVGPDLQNYLKTLDIDYKNESIKYVPGIYGEDKLHLIRDSDVLILPSYSENFGNVVAEALACERPVITTTGTPWHEIEKVGCGIYIPPEAEALFAAMQKMYLKSPKERDEMGKKGRAYVFENFDWEKKAKEIFDRLQT